MITTLKALLGFGPKTDFAELVKDGATILDVRTKGEYAGGHIKGSIQGDSGGPPPNGVRSGHAHRG